MPTSLSPSERTLRAKLAAHTMHAHHNGHAVTAAARAAGPGNIEYWVAKVDVDLPEEERLRRAEHLKAAHYTRMAFVSAKARRERGAE
jgi:hypothetical protein